MIFPHVVSGVKFKHFLKKILEFVNKRTESIVNITFS